MAPVDAVAPGQYWPACATWALEKSREGNRYRKADDGGGVTSRSRSDVIRGMMPGAAKYSRAGGSERVAVLFESCTFVWEGRLAGSMSSHPLRFRCILSLSRRGPPFVEHEAIQLLVYAQRLRQPLLNSIHWLLGVVFRRCTFAQLMRLSAGTVNPRVDTEVWVRHVLAPFRLIVMLPMSRFLNRIVVANRW